VLGTVTAENEAGEAAVATGGETSDGVADGVVLFVVDGAG